MHFHRSITEIGRTPWENCFPGAVEGFDYHLAVERAGIAGFTLGWVAAWRAGRLAAAVPCFSTRYDLATTAQGRLRRTMETLRGAVPGKLTIGLSCLGSPVTETCQIGLTPESDPEGQRRLLADLLAFWQRRAAGEGIRLFGVKDLSDGDSQRFGTVLEGSGFRAAPSLPGAVLPIRFATAAEYLAQRGSSTRKDIRRKLRSRDEVAIEDRADPVGAIADIMRLYEQTRTRSDWTFETLDADYFREVLRQKGARLVLYRHRDRVLGANLLLETRDALLDKFFVMDAQQGRALNLYFLSWMENVEQCVARGIGEYHAGAASYDAKLRLGCRLQRRWIYFRHGGRAGNLLLRAAAPFLAVDQPAPPGPAWEGE